MTALRAIWAVHIRNAKLLRRQKHLVAQAILVPLVVLTLTVFVMGGEMGDAFPIALVNPATSPEARQFESAVQDSRSNITPYFTIVETDPVRAEAQVASGRLLLSVHVPEDFASTRMLQVETFNVNSDATKNTRLRLEHAINRYLGSRNELVIEPRLVLEKPDDVWRAAFLGGSSVLLALFLGATLMAANLFAFERENRTSKEIWLSPVHPAIAGVGIIVTSVTAALVTSFPTLLAALLFGLRVQLTSLALVFTAMLPVLVGCAGLGLLLGRYLKHYRTIQPIVILVSIATFFVGGGFVGVSFLPPAAQLFSDVWIFSRIFEWFNPVLHGFVPGISPAQYGWLAVTGLLGLGLLALSYRTNALQETNGGQ